MKKVTHMSVHLCVKKSWWCLRQDFCQRTDRKENLMGNTTILNCSKHKITKNSQGDEHSCYHFLQVLSHLPAFLTTSNENCTIHSNLVNLYTGMSKGAIGRTVFWKRFKEMQARNSQFYSCTCSTTTVRRNPNIRYSTSRKYYHLFDTMVACGIRLVRYNTVFIWVTKPWYLSCLAKDCIRMSPTGKHWHSPFLHFYCCRIIHVWNEISIGITGILSSSY